MNWGELKNEIRDLGFEEDESIEEYASVVISSANRAINTIALDVLPILAKHKITQDGGESGKKRYNLLELTKEAGMPKFFSFADERPVKTSDGDYSRFGDYEIEGRHTLVMDASLKGEFEIFYNRIPTPITPDTPDKTEIELDLMMHTILPLLCAYYVWLDDDERKATTYYNQYESLKDSIVGKNDKPKLEIRGGF